MEQENKLLEVLESGKRLSNVLARTTFLQRIPMAESTQFTCGMRLHLNSSVLLENLCSGFPKLYEMMKNREAPQSPDFQHLFHTEMGVSHILPHIQTVVRIMIADEVALRSGLNSTSIYAVVIKDLKKCAKEIQLLERKVQILDAIHPSEIKGREFLAIWSGKEELEVSIEVSEEWNELMKKGLDSNETDQEQIILCNSEARLNRLKVSLWPCNIKNMKVKEVKDLKSRIKQLEKQLLEDAGKKAPEAKAPPDEPVKNLLNWVVENQSDPSTFWWSFNTDLREAVQFGSQTSILLKKFLDNLPEGQQSAMKIEQLQVSLKMFAKDKRNVAAKKILELELSGFSSTHQNITGACEEDNGTVHLFKKLFIALDMIFRHPIRLPEGRREKVKVSREIYVEQCHGLMKELAEKLKLKLKKPQEFCDSEEEEEEKEELRDIIKSWGELSPPQWDSFYGTSSRH